MFKNVMNQLQGRHTAFALFFTVTATTMSWFHRLDSNYIAFVTVMQGWVFAHSLKESRYDDHNHDSDSK